MLARPQNCDSERTAPATFQTHELPVVTNEVAHLSPRGEAQTGQPA